MVMLLMSPKGDLAYRGAIVFALTTFAAIVTSGITKCAVLPAIGTFPSFCATIGLFFIPVGFVVVWSNTPALGAVPPSVPTLTIAAYRGAEVTLGCAVGWIFHWVAEIVVDALTCVRPTQRVATALRGSPGQGGTRPAGRRLISTSWWRLTMW
jgi:hypothetical protein